MTTWGIFRVIFALYIFLYSIFCEAHDCRKTQVWEIDRAYPAGSWVQRLGVRYQSRWWSINKKPEVYSGPLKVWLQQGKCD